LAGKEKSAFQITGHLRKTKLMSDLQTDITIVGGGPVGLYLAGMLLMRGYGCRVLERKSSTDMHSKSLGIHPVSLELFEEAGIIEPFLKYGLKIRQGIAYWNRDEIGTISFEKCPPPYPFILAIPQWKTEQILEEWVQSMDPEAMVRDAEVVSMKQDKYSVDLSYKSRNQIHRISSKYVAGCDGKNSFIRQAVNIPFEGGSYPDSYIMGDFDDNTDYGSDAIVFLHNEGLIECFPLPNGHRRWVIKTEGYIEDPDKEFLKKILRERLGHDLDSCENHMLSGFGVQHYLAASLHAGRVLLAGDSAHVVSPIGGQGMNLGWLGARHCVNALSSAIKSEKKPEQYLKSYSKTQRKIAKHAARRAEMNMHLGRKETANTFYKIAVSILIKTRLSHFLAKLFTMRGLGRWPI
jgi:2-polyprenyl-6-methoxyphenol hydroxylase-like FAD-dependent oxidoreductase